ncbi:Alcohol dehydrogenase, N-terminal [Dillenia turbinata]|uniref:Alcohol dehydrogenase, N-terminal n=1 Tax=Dillenia turbinata TaxID=194707 RepID=A0AAN8ZG58_9MAGN
MARLCFTIPNASLSVSAAICWGVGEPIKVEEIEVDPPKAGEVRIKILCASLCHSDIICASGYPLPLFPRVLGHEGVG